MWGDGAPGGADEMPQGERQCIFATSLSSKVKCLTVLCVLLETDFVMHSDTPEPNLLLQAFVEVSLRKAITSHDGTIILHMKA